MPIPMIGQLFSHDFLMTYPSLESLALQRSPSTSESAEARERRAPAAAQDGGAPGHHVTWRGMVGVIFDFEAVGGIKGEY